MRALDLKTDPKTGFLRVRYPLTWAGVREYDAATMGGKPGQTVRIAHLQKDVASEGFIRACRGLIATLGHPSDAGGRDLWVHSQPAKQDRPDEWVTPRDVCVGWVGDSIDMVEVEGAILPVATVTISDPTTISLLRSGAMESSLGYWAQVDYTPGVIEDGPSAGQTYDARHVLDFDEDPPEDPVGPNHFAVGLWAGRGAELSRVLGVADAGGTEAVEVEGRLTLRWTDGRHACIGYTRGVADTPKDTSPAVQTRTLRRVAPGPITKKRLAARDATLSIEVPDELAPIFESMLSAIEAEMANLMTELTGVQAANETMQTELAEAGGLESKVAELEAQIADLAPRAAAADRAEAQKLAEAAKALGVKVSDSASPDDVRFAMLRALAPKAAESATILGPESVRACLDAALAVRQDPGVEPAKKSQPTTDSVPTPNTDDRYKPISFRV